MIGSIFALICADLVSPGGNPRLACQKALEAYIHPYKIEEKTSKISRLLRGELEDQAGEGVTHALTAAYVVGIKREVAFSTRRLPIADRATLRVSSDTVGIYFGWAL